MKRTLEPAGLPLSVTSAPRLALMIIIAALFVQVPWHPPGLLARRSNLPLMRYHCCAVNCHPHWA
eukprot:362139-Chlamydomonas_euryale.AAC.5